MFKIILNKEFNAEESSSDLKGKYLFEDTEAGTITAIGIWVEKLKKTERYPDGKVWIRLPKDNAAKRRFVAEEIFIDNNVNGVYEVTLNDKPPRQVNNSGIKEEVLKWLNEEQQEEYKTLVTNAMQALNVAREKRKKKKLEEMTKEELQEYIESMKNGIPLASQKSAPKSFLDMFTKEQYDRYNELVITSQENKRNRPKLPRGPLSEEEKVARREKKKQADIQKAEMLLAQLLEKGE